MVSLVLSLIGVILRYPSGRQRRYRSGVADFGKVFPEFRRSAPRIALRGAVSKALRSSMCLPPAPVSRELRLRPASRLAAASVNLRSSQSRSYRSGAAGAAGRSVGVASRPIRFRKISGEVRFLSARWTRPSLIEYWSFFLWRGLRPTLPQFFRASLGSALHHGQADSHLLAGRGSGTPVDVHCWTWSALC